MHDHVTIKLSLCNSNTTKCATSPNSLDSDLGALSHCPTDSAFVVLSFRKIHFQASEESVPLALSSVATSKKRISKAKLSCVTRF